MRRRRRKPSRAGVFASESAMCAAYIEWVKKTPGWTCYAETAGWDILVVSADGVQVGIQAKLKFNLEVLGQAIESRYHHGLGPDFRAILVPECQAPDLCRALGLNVIQSRKEWNGTIQFYPDLVSDHVHRWQDWHFANPVKRHELPEYVPDVQAGVPSPVSLTKWKIAALEICALIEVRGHVTREDFKRAGIDHRRWTNGWLEPVVDVPGAYCWRKSTGDMGFAKQHPEVYPQVLEKITARLGGNGA